VADSVGARSESTRESGLPVAGGGGPGAGSGGEARVLERRSRRGVETGERVGAVALERRGRRCDREGKKREGGASLFGQRRAGADRAGPGGSESGEARVARGHAWAGPRRKRGGRAHMNSKVLHLFELV
jgi:hypothetical protein